MQIGNRALIVEGGAIRGAFSCGVLDAFLAQDFSPFDSFWGVSAGATNLAAYLANMPKRNHKIYTDYSCRKEFLTPMRFLFGGDLVNIDWLWQQTIADLGLDLDTIAADGRPFYLTVTNASNGKVEYHLAKPENLIETMKASSALPIFYRLGVPLDGCRYVDGGVSNAIPIDEVIWRGAKKIMVIRSQPKNYVKPQVKFKALLKQYLRSFPAIVEPMLTRADRYNEKVALIRNPPIGVEVIEICPPEELNVSRFSRDVKLIEQSYQSGLDASNDAIKRWNEQA